LEIRDGEVLGLIGRNGSGKTSLMRAIAGLLQIEQGYVRIGGVDVTHLPVNRRGVVLVTPTSLFPHLEVDSHITWGARLKGRKVDGGYSSRVKSALGIDFRGPVGNLSLGMRARVALATALLATPPVILVDETFSSIDGRREFILTYGRLATSAKSDLVFTSQDEADGDLSDHLYVMNNGLVRLAESSAADGLKDDS
jgi:molybdate/tungstate transport system ATP-binding protein